MPMQKNVVISNQLGLHARASAKLTQLAAKFSSEIFIIKNQQKVNAKSIMGVMMLAAAMGVEITVETSGVDEQAAIDAIIDLFNQKFGEGK